MKRRIAAAVAAGALLIGALSGFNGSPRGHRPPIWPRHRHTPTGTPGATCNIAVPVNPLSAQGLATPYVLSGPSCAEADADETAFVQATILGAAGQVSVYSPLVITAGTQPAAPPVVPVIAPGSVVGIVFGFNAIDLSLTGPGARYCVNGLGTDFGQYAYCDTPQFYAAANTAVRAGKLTVPALGTTSSGEVCPSQNDYRLVDQDPADNVATTYLVLPDGQTAQDTAANEAAFPSATVLGNPSDNALLTNFIDPALGCTPWTAPNLADPGTNVSSTALDSLQARDDQAEPVANVPLVDEMTLIDGRQSLAKTLAYRAGADQPFNSDGLTEQNYCSGLYSQFPSFMIANQGALTTAASPDPAVANSLFTFLASRFIGTYEMVLPSPGIVATCDKAIGKPDPVSVTTDSNGVAIAAVITPTA